MSQHAFASSLLLTLFPSISLLTACSKQNSASLITEAKAKLAAGNTRSTMAQPKNAVLEANNDAEARFALGKPYLEQGNLAGAGKACRRAREAGYSATPVTPMIARALIGQREYQRVLKEIDAAPSPDSPLATVLGAARARSEPEHLLPNGTSFSHKREARNLLKSFQGNKR